MTVTVHHLNNSRSQRILWLLEELNTDYDIVPYQRDAETNLAPPELLSLIFDMLEISQHIQLGSPQGNSKSH